MGVTGNVKNGWRSFTQNYHVLCKREKLQKKCNTKKPRYLRMGKRRDLEKRRRGTLKPIRIAGRNSYGN